MKRLLSCSRVLGCGLYLALLLFMPVAFLPSAHAADFIINSGAGGAAGNFTMIGAGVADGYPQIDAAEPAAGFIDIMPLASSVVTITEFMSIAQITSAVQTALGNANFGDTVTVTGQKTAVRERIDFDIPSGVTLVWKALYSGRLTYYSGLIRLFGNGVFELAEDGDIRVEVGNGIGVYGPEVKVTGGSIYVAADSSVGIDISVGKLTMTGGSILTDQHSSRAIEMYSGTISITGGVIRAAYGGSTAVWLHSGTLEIGGNADIYTYQATHIVYMKTGSLQISGNAKLIFDGRLGHVGANIYTESADIYVDGGFVGCTGSTRPIAAIRTMSGNVFVSGGIIDSEYGGAILSGTWPSSGGNVTVTGGSIESLAVPSITTYGGLLTVSGGEVWGLDTLNGLIAVTGGRVIHSSGDVIHLHGVGAVAYYSGADVDGHMKVYDVATNEAGGMIVKVDTFIIDKAWHGTATSITQVAGDSNFTAVWDTTQSTPRIKFTLWGGQVRYLPWGAYNGAEDPDFEIVFPGVGPVPGSPSKWSEVNTAGGSLSLNGGRTLLIHKPYNAASGFAGYNFITIEADAGHLGNVTIDGQNSGTNTGLKIRFRSGNDGATLNIRNLKIAWSNGSDDALIAMDGAYKLVFSGVNELSNGGGVHNSATIHVGPGRALEVSGEGSGDYLTVSSGQLGAAIGGMGVSGGVAQSGGKVTIGNGIITIISNNIGAGIGGGGGGNGGTGGDGGIVVVRPDSSGVLNVAGYYGAGIGGGFGDANGGNGGEILLQGRAVVNATSRYGGAGIGGGGSLYRGGSGGKIDIVSIAGEGTPSVTVQVTFGNGAGIGGGGIVGNASASVGGGGGVINIIGGVVQVKGLRGAAIGGGSGETGGAGGTITLSGAAEVSATVSESGAAIGGGFGEDEGGGGGSIDIEGENTSVTATVSYGNGAAIGGGGSNGTGGAGGAITIKEGEVTADGLRGAGIGGGAGETGGAGGTITLSGAAEVRATASEGGAAIGGGFGFTAGGSGGSIDIEGGNTSVTATVSYGNGAAIGGGGSNETGGAGGAITIKEGEVTAGGLRGAGIGGGAGETGGAGGTVSITGGLVNAKADQNGAVNGGAGIGGGFGATTGGAGGDVTIEGINTRVNATVAGGYGAGIGGGGSNGTGGSGGSLQIVDATVSAKGYNTSGTSGSPRGMDIGSGFGGTSRGAAGSLDIDSTAGNRASLTMEANGTGAPLTTSIGTCVISDASGSGSNTAATANITGTYSLLTVINGTASSADAQRVYWKANIVRGGVGVSLSYTGTPAGTRQEEFWAESIGGTTFTGSSYTMPLGAVTVTGGVRAMATLTMIPVKTTLIAGVEINGQVVATATAENIEGAPTFSIEGAPALPAGLALNTSTGEITVTDASLLVVTPATTVTVRVVGATSGTATDTITITVKAQTYTLSVTVGSGGSVSGMPSGDYAQGTSVSVTAVSNNGYRFTNWTVSGVTISGGNNANPATFNMPSNAVTLTANFEQDAPSPSIAAVPTTGNSILVVLGLLLTGLAMVALRRNRYQQA
jgi:hypothetical protein